MMWEDSTREGYISSWNLALLVGVTNIQINRSIRNLLRAKGTTGKCKEEKKLNTSTHREEIIYWIDEVFLKDLAKVARRNKDRYMDVYYGYFKDIQEVRELTEHLNRLNKEIDKAKKSLEEYKKARVEANNYNYGGGSYEDDEEDYL